jgi:transcriptional regulator with XRE-family HTH domain
MPGKNSRLPLNYRYFGNQFQLWRQLAGLPREELADAAGYSVDTVKAVEMGRRPVPPRLAEIADERCGARGILLAGLNYLKRESFPERSRDYFEYEADAIALNSYEPLLIPGLLQTEEHARALIGNHCPPLDQETAEKRIAARLERHELLTRKQPVACSFVIYEAALRTPVGGAEAHKRQLLHLLELAELRHLSIQVLPFERAIPAALMGPMVLLETSDHAHFALIEGQSWSQLTSDPDDVSSLSQRYGMIRMEALSTEESVRFIQRLVDDL